MWFSQVQGYGRSRWVEHLIRLEMIIRKGIADKKITLALFFDLENPYDTTWRYGIQRDLYTYGLCLRMPLLIWLLLKERSFRVSISNLLSHERKQESGVPQWSILSVTLFAVKVNPLAAVIPNYINTSLFVDDLQISCSGNTVSEAKTNIQPVLDDIYRWATRNRFKLSATKANCILFSQKPTIMRPVICLREQQISEVTTAKFGGLYWDQWLTWIPHIAQLKNCLKSLNLPWMLSCKEWGGGRLADSNDNISIDHTSKVGLWLYCLQLCLWGNAKNFGCCDERSYAHK